MRRGKAVVAPMDLTAHAPRGLDAELEGYAWLPRMLDKARATLAGKAGRFSLAVRSTTRAWRGSV